MTKAEIRAWVRSTLAVANALLDQWDDEKETDWHGYVGEALGALRAAQEALNCADPSTLPPAEEDRNAPWVCTGCSLVYPVCPDPNAHDCPGCGAKVCPARLWSRAALRCERKNEDGCGSEVAERADGDVLCGKCGIAYRLHPYCANSKLPESMSASQFPQYFLHVACGGRHVKL
jgi:hypothetical protein